MHVLKVGGRAQADPSLASAVAMAWKQSPGSLCVVHGGGDEISSYQKRLGLEPRMQNGRRVTTAEDLMVVRMVLSGLANKRLVSSLRRAGATAAGVSGEDGSLLSSDARDYETLGLVGKTPTVNPTLLHALLAERILPVISPVSVCTDPAISDALNVNGDDAAAAIAIALRATDLIFVSDVAGVRDASGSHLSELDTNEARELISSGAAEGGMAAKLEAALAAIEGGVGVVRIGTIDTLVNESAGTIIRSRTGVAI